MTQVAPTPKLPPPPQLRSKCKLTEKILTDPCPEFEAVRRILGTKDVKLGNAEAVNKFVEAAQAHRDQVQLEYYADNSLENFKRLIEANAEHDRAQSAFKQVVIIQSGAMTEWVNGDDVREATMAALRVIQKRLGKKISELNDEERKRMEEAGLDPTGEHPSITGLKARLSTVAEAIIKLQDGARFNWNEYSSLFQ